MKGRTTEDYARMIAQLQAVMVCLGHRPGMVHELPHRDGISHSRQVMCLSCQRWGYVVAIPNDALMLTGQATRLQCGE